MSTRGCIGFTKNGTDKITYNHFDSYPSHLGNVILDFICNVNNKELNDIFDNLQIVSSSDIPTQKQINEVVKIFGKDNLKKDFLNKSPLNKNTKSLDKELDNYLMQSFGNLLSLSQGEPKYFKQGLKYIIDDISFMGDSLFCEYAYILNLDNNSLEFYVGANKKDTNNRFSQYIRDNTGYKECKLTISIPFDIIRENQKMCLDIMDFISEKIN